MKSITITNNDYVAINAWEDEGAPPIDSTYEIVPADGTHVRRSTSSTLSENSDQNSKDTVNRTTRKDPV